jgi:uncharacterized protein
MPFEPGCGVIDCDGHVIEPDEVWLRHLPRSQQDRAPRRILDEHGFERVLIEGRIHRRGAHRRGEGPRVKHQMLGAHEPLARLRDLDLEGIDRAVLFPTIAFICFPSVEDPVLATALCRAYNDWISEFCNVDRRRLTAAALVPLHQTIEGSIIELHRAIEDLGLCGVGVRPNPIQGYDLMHPAMEPFWIEVERLRVPVFIHEGASALVAAAGADRFENYLIRHALCHPLEQMTACAGLILSGVLERHPALRIAFLEAGVGWVPFLLDRMDEHVRVMGHLVAENISGKPSDYFRRQCFVACECDEVLLPAAIELLGDDNIVFASDYPHFNGTFPGAVAPLRDHPQLSLDARAKILGKNAGRLLAGDAAIEGVSPSRANDSAPTVATNA